MTREKQLAKLLQGFMNAVVDSMNDGHKIPHGIDRVFLRSYETLREYGYETELCIKK
jgi:hypothetical protein